MGKIIVSPVTRWPGTVSLHDPLSVPMVAALERAIGQARALASPTQGEFDAALLPGLLPCIEAFSLGGLPAQVGMDNFPGTPRLESAKLIAWLLREVMNLYTEATADPLA